MLAATSGAASAPARGEGSSAPPPVERVARELRTGAKSVIVFVSAGDKEYVATGGARRPAGDQRFRVGSVTKTFTATIVLKLVEEGALRLDSTLEDHVPGVIPRGDEITIRQLLQHRSGLANSRITRRGSSVRSDRPRRGRSTPCASRGPSRWPSPPAPSSATRTRITSRWVSSSRRSRDTRTHRSSSSASSTRSGSATRAAADAAPAGPRRRRLQPECSLGGRRDRLERARPLSFLLRASLRAHSVQCHPRDDEEDS